VYVKDPSELDFPVPIPSSAISVYCLLAPEAGDMKEAGSTDPQCCEVLKFRPGKDRLTDIVADIGATMKAQNLTPGRLSVIAPFYFLKEHFSQGIPPQGAEGPFSETLVFANNFTVQGIKVKTCKPILNQAFLTLCRLGAGDLADCPFVGMTDGIYLMDLKCLPEKLRLDHSRAANLIHTCMSKWVRAVTPECTGSIDT
jgi:hypothetical protein